jgi:hypothetical protein
LHWRRVFRSGEYSASSAKIFPLSTWNF